MFTLNCKGRLMVIERPVVMGIINTTPDSFFSNSRKQSVSDVLITAEQMLKDGAAILDIGGQSTRPGSPQSGAEEELNRVIPAIEAIHKQFPEAILSIDTYHAQVARQAVQAGASMVNDISAGLLDEAMLPTVASLNVPYICMHMKGTVETMQQDPQYDNVSRDVLDFFIKRVEECRLAGIKDIIIDPGFGFGKTVEHNFKLLKDLHVFKMLDKPILLGISRKSFIYKTLGIIAEEALNGTSVLHTVGLQQGATILRVHDVKEAVQAIRLIEQLH